MSGLYDLTCQACKNEWMSDQAGDPCHKCKSTEVSAEPNLATMISRAERMAARVKNLGGEYIYDGVFVYHDGFQFWLCTEQGNEVALEPRTMSMFIEYLKRKGAIK